VVAYCNVPELSSWPLVSIWRSTIIILELFRADICIPEDICKLFISYLYLSLLSPARLLVVYNMFTFNCFCITLVNKLKHVHTLGQGDPSICIDK
jgi:hypothetical protein